MIGKVILFVKGCQSRKYLDLLCRAVLENKRLASMVAQAWLTAHARYAVPIDDWEAICRENCQFAGILCDKSVTTLDKGGN